MIVLVLYVLVILFDSRLFLSFNCLCQSCPSLMCLTHNNSYLNKNEEKRNKACENHSSVTHSSVISIRKLLVFRLQLVMTFISVYGYSKQQCETDWGDLHAPEAAGQWK